MANLSVFGPESFDLVFHPCSNFFVPDIRPVWQECFHVLRPGGCLLGGSSTRSAISSRTSVWRTVALRSGVQSPIRT